MSDGLGVAQALVGAGFAAYKRMKMFLACFRRQPQRPRLVRTRFRGTGNMVYPHIAKDRSAKCQTLAHQTMQVTHSGRIGVDAAVGHGWEHGRETVKKGAAEVKREQGSSKSKSECTVSLFQAL